MDRPANKPCLAFEALALRVLAERIEHGDTSPVIEKVFSVAAA